MSVLTIDARASYDKALQKGKKEGGCPLILDHILKESGITAPAEIPLGVIQVPMEQIVGTKSEGRMNCFSKNFYPLLAPDSEFGAKWISLCRSHLDEGIHDPIKAYEYMNNYYVVEGNKRVSVLKFYEAVTISANVIRILPPQYDNPKIQLYYEYVDFYNLTEINYIYFTKTGSFGKLQRMVGKNSNEEWTVDDKANFSSVFYRFKNEYTKNIGQADYTTISDAFLYFITLYPFDSLIDMTTKEFHSLILKLKDELALLSKDTSLKLQMDPVETKKSLLKTMLPRTGPLKIAFIHDKNPELSGWTYSHDMGRTHIEKVFQKDILTSVYYNVDSSRIGTVLDDAIYDDNELIFATSPVFLKDCIKSAIEHPEVNILDCCLSTSHKSIRTYYSRMYEVKFLMGAIAGSMTTNNQIGYVADYPIYGTIAGINAYALGAKLVNPRARVHLLWTKTMDSVDIDAYFLTNKVNIICDQDMLSKGQYDQRFGLYMIREDMSIWNMAMCVWNWSTFYEKIVSDILYGNFKKTEKTDSKESYKSTNYWWGLSSDIVHLIHSQRLPMGTIRLIELLKTSIINGSFHPYAGTLYDQNGTQRNAADHTMEPSEIITMNWLVDNIIGTIPSSSVLNPEAKELIKIQGVEEKERLI